VTSKLFAIAKPLLIVVVALLIAAGLFLNKPAPQQAAIVYQPPLVNVAKAVKQDLAISVRAQGTVTAKTETIITAEVSGRITEVSSQFYAGGFFNKGDILLKIDQRNYLADLKRSEAAVASAESALATEQGRAEVAYQDWLKYNKSVTRSKAANDLALHKPQLAQAKAKLDSTKADLSHAHNQLDRTTIRAPYDGLLRSKRADIGQYVNTGAAVAAMFAVDVAQLRLSIPESKLSYLNLPTLANESGTAATVDLTASIGGQMQHWQAKLVRTEGVFDERSRVLFTVAEIDDPYGLKSQQHKPLRVGTFVHAQIEGKVFKDLIVLPRHILRSGNKIWVLDGEQRLQNRDVTILRTGGKYMYVTAGVNEGDLICLSNISDTIAGKGVRIATTTRTDQQIMTNTEQQFDKRAEQQANPLNPIKTERDERPPVGVNKHPDLSAEQKS